MPTKDALDAMQTLADETGLDLSDEGLAAGQPQALQDPDDDASDAEPEPPEAAAPEAPGGEAPQPAQAQPHHVPLATYLEEREQRQRLQRQIDEIQASRQQARRPEPDPFLDPGGFARQLAGQEFDARFQRHVLPVLQQLQQAIDYQHRVAANGKYGAGEVAKAEAEIMRLRQAGALTPADVIRLISSPQRPNVYENAAELMRERSLLSELGGDPKAYRERILNEALADPDFQARAIEAARAQAGGPAQAQIARPLVRLPSVNRSGSGAGSPPLRQDESDDQLIAWATNRKSPRPE